VLVQGLLQGDRVNSLKGTGTADNQDVRSPLCRKILQVKLQLVIELLTVEGGKGRGLGTGSWIGLGCLWRSWLGGRLCRWARRDLGGGRNGSWARSVQ
jgi:hypothetical protein